MDLPMNAPGLLTQILLLVLQLATILAVTYACGRLLALLRQPRVVGEIAGGLLLGPLVLGHWFPSVSAFLFSASGLRPLEVVSNIGLVLFLFLMGTELDLAAIRHNRGAALTITVGSIALPFALGAALSPLLLVRFELRQGSHLAFLLFTGIAMSVTALPVLARIIQERKHTRQPISPRTASIALVCAAANDLLAWLLLALTLTLIHDGQGGQSLTASCLRLLVLAGYLGIMFFVVRHVAARLLAQRPSPPKALWLPVVIVFAFLSARVTEVLGVHAFFGAFFAGVCIPVLKGRSGSLEHSLHRMLSPVVGLTLPIFFALTGLRMRREMFSGNGLGWFAIVLLLAVSGKIGGAMLAARGSGMRWNVAAQIGILLNTRGLVELIVLNIGYREGIFSPLIFTLFVLMAIVTTAMTTPLFDLSNRLLIESID